MNSTIHFRIAEETKRLAMQAAERQQVSLTELMRQRSRKRTCTYPAGTPHRQENCLSVPETLTRPFSVPLKPVISRYNP